MESVFRALADPARRQLLDSLFREDGQSLRELTAELEMTRFGVMKHLRLLEDAGLVTSRRVGREKLHYLNPVPIQRLSNRWISKFAAPWSAALTGLKQHLEEELTMAKPQHVYEVYIRTTPEKLWAAITEPDLTQQYYYNTRIEADAWLAGAAYRYRGLDGSLVAEGEILEIEPNKRFVATFRALWSPELAEEAPSTLTWEISPAGADVCRLSVVFEAPDQGSRFFVEAGGGMPMILSGLKTLLETGAPLAIGS